MPDSPRLAQLTAMLADDPADPFLRYALAMEQLSLGDAAAAARSFQDLSQNSPDYVPTYLMLGQTLQQLGRETDAAEALRRGVAAAKKAGDLHAVGELEGLLAILE